MKYRCVIPEVCCRQTDRQTRLSQYSALPYRGQSKQWTDRSAVASTAGSCSRDPHAPAVNCSLTQDLYHDPCTLSCVVWTAFFSHICIELWLSHNFANYKGVLSSLSEVLYGLIIKQESLALASMARDDPPASNTASSTAPSSSTAAAMRGKVGSEFET